MNIIKSILLQPLVLSIVTGIFIFIVCYLRFPSLIQFFKAKTLNSQKEVLDIVSRMMLKTQPDKVVVQLWIFRFRYGIFIFFTCLAKFAGGAGLSLHRVFVILGWRAAGDADDLGT